MGIKNRFIETSLSGYTATIPSTPVQSAWTYTDIGDGCFFINKADGIINFRGTNTIYTLDGDPSKLVYRYYVGTQGHFTKIKSAVDWLTLNMSGSTELLLDSGTHLVEETISINLPYNLNIRSFADNTTTLVPTSGLAGTSMFDIKSNVYIERLAFDATGVELSPGVYYGQDSSENCLQINENNLYCEFRNFTMRGFYNGIDLTKGSEFFIHNSIIENMTNTGVIVNTTQSGSTIDIEVTNFNNNPRGIYLYSGATSYFDIFSCVFNCSAGQTGITYNPVGYTLSNVNNSIINNKWNGVGTFINGFDFTLERDSNVYLSSNIGIEEKNPHAKINVINNTGKTTITSSANYYRANFNNTNYYSTKFKVENNKVIYYPINKRDCVVWVSGNIQVNQNNRTLNVGLIKNGNGVSGSTSDVISPLTVRTASANQPVPFSIVAYITDMDKNDYVEIYVNSANSGDVVILQDLNFFIDSK